MSRKLGQSCHWFIPFVSCNTALDRSKSKAKFKKYNYNKPKEYFENLVTQQNKQARTLTNYIRLPEKGLIASYKVAQLLAKRKNAHNEAESVIAPALAIVVETMLLLFAFQSMFI